MNLIKILILLIPVTFLTGCASVLTSYPKRMHDVRANISTHNYKAAIKAAKKTECKQNKQLLAVELGRIYQLDGNYKASLSQYGNAIKQMRANQLKAKVEASRLLQNAGSLLVNPRMIDYRIAAYESVILYTYQALNYLGQNDLSDALVSIRRGQNEQNWIKQNQAKELADATKASKKKKWDLNPQKFAHYYASTMQAARGIKSTFENGFFDYVSALAYLGKKDYNDAFISLKSANALAPDNLATQKLLLQTLVQRGGDSTQLDQYMKNFGVKKAPVIKKDSGLVAVIFEQSLIPPISNVSFHFPLTLGNQFQQIFVTIPAYKVRALIPPPMLITSDGKQTQTYLVANNYRLAAKSLEEQYPMILFRETLSVVSKTILSNKVGKKDPLAGLGVMLYNAVTSGADQRSWLTLPRYEQVWQKRLKAGQHNLTLQYLGRNTNVPVTVLRNGITLLWVSSPGGKLSIKTLTIQGQ